MIYAGIDLGGTSIKGALVTDKGEILRKKSIPAGAERSHREVVTDMANLILDLMTEEGLTPEEVASVGVGSPGAIDPEKGEVIFAANFADFRNVPMRSIMEEILEMPVYVDNDANVAALGECMFGAGEGCRNCVALTLGTGLGGGVIIDGKIFSGAFYGGAELGHQVIVVDGEPCTCGRKGCWEAYSSATALIRMGKEAALAHPDSQLGSLAGEGLAEMEAKTVFDAAQAGDEVAQGVIDVYIKYLAAGIVNTINVFQPEVLIVGGGVSAQGEKLMEPLREKVQQEVFGGQADKTQLRAATLGNDAGVIGAAMLGIE